jgi:hypothetical protein
LGDRPLVSVEDAHASLIDRGGRLTADFDVPARIALTPKRRVSFDNYAALESRLIERLLSGERAEDVLAAKPLPKLSEGSWLNVAADHIEVLDDTAGGEAFAWFGDALLHLVAGHRPPERPRPWHASFVRALGKWPDPDPESVFNDWLADELWMLRWMRVGPFDVGRAELATRLAVARCVQRWIALRGIPEGQAAAEAVMVCELAAEGSSWPEAASNIARSPSPADPLD